MGGGDGKVDTNTYPVADAVSDGRWIGAPRGDDRWAFAFNAMEGLEAEGAKRRRQDRRDGSGVLPTKFGTRAPTIASGSPERSPQWADADANPFHPFAVEMPKGTLSEVTDLCEADLAASLARLKAQGLVVVRAAEEQSGPRCGKLYDLLGTFDLAGSELHSTLYRTLIERHRSEVIWAAEQTLQIVGEDFEQLRLWAGTAGAVSFGRRWRAFLKDYANHNLRTMWEQDPASVYDWLSTLADLQDEMGVLQSRPCECSLRTDLAKWTEVKIAVLSRRYESPSQRPSV